MADFGTVNMKAQVLDNVSRPGGGTGNGVPSGKSERPMVVGESRNGGPVGQGTAPGAGAPLSVGQTRPGGVTGQAASDRSVKMRKASWIAD